MYNRSKGKSNHLISFVLFHKQTQWENSSVQWEKLAYSSRRKKPFLKRPAAGTAFNINYAYKAASRRLCVFTCEKLFELDCIYVCIAELSKLAILLACDSVLPVTVAELFAVF
jgi:hypothetical protein